MPPRTKRGVGSGEAEDVGKLLLRLKLKVAALHGGGGSAVQECLRAAQILESSVDGLERGPSALPLALSKGSAAEAKKSIDKARHLSADVASFLVSLTNNKGVSQETRWPVLRPVMRLLLWLVPEHLPTPEAVSASSVTVPAGQNTAAGRQSTAPTQPDEDWRQEVAIIFAHEVTTVTLAQVVLAMAVCMVCKDDSIRDNTWHRGILGARRLEECLIWLTLMARLKNIASTLLYAGRVEGLPSTSSSHSAEQVPLAEHLLSGLARQAGLLFKLGGLVCFWMSGQLQPNTSLPERGMFSQKAVSTPEQRAFAASFEPSHELANATGLWRSPAVILQQLVLLLWNVPLHGLNSNPLSSQAYVETCRAHGLALRLLQPAECLPSQGGEVQDYAKRLPSLVEMHLRGLALMYRLALACCSLEDLWEVGPSIVTTAYNCINETIAPMLIQDPALLSGAVRYLPRGMYSAADSTPLLIKVMNRCDVTLVAVQQQRQQQQQLHEGLGRHGADQPGERVRQEVGQPSSSVLQHNIKTSQHSGRMMQQQSVAARHMLVQTGHMLDQGADMLDCAIAAGELARLAHQALKAHLDNGDEEVDMLIAQAQLFLLQLLRPTAYSASTLSSRQGRAWVLCLSNIAHRLDALLGEEEAEQSSPLWNGVGLRVLLEQILPALQHAAASGHRSTPDHSPASGGDRAAKADYHPAPQAYSRLLLLGAAAQVLNACTSAASTSHAACMILSKGWTQQGPPAGSAALLDDGDGDHVTGLKAAYALAAELVSGGAWWQEAKAHYPLLLIDTLNVVIQALPIVLPHSGNTAGSWTWPCARCAAQRHEGGAAEGNASSRPGSCPVPQPREEEVVKQGVSVQHAAGDMASSQGGAQTGATQALNQGDGQPSDSHLCSSAAAGDESGSSTHHTIGFSTCRGSLDTTGLMFALVARLWEMLSDKDIVGEAPRPAAWMQESGWYAKQSAKVLVEVLKSLDGKVKDLIDQLVAPGTALHNQPEGSSSSSSSSSSDAQASCADEHCLGTSGAGQHGKVEHTPPSAGQGSRVIPEQTAQLALQLASQVPHLTMEDLESAAEGSPGKGNLEFIAAMFTLRGHLSVKPALRAVCMLALTGHLNQQQREVVTALLGGRGSSSSGHSTTTSELGSDSTACSASSLPIPEPPKLVEARQQGSITLQDLAIWVLDLQQAPHPPVIDHVLLAFGADQLPGLALVHEANSRPAPPGSSGQKHEQQLDSDTALSECHQEEEEELVRQRHELLARAGRASELLGPELMAQYQSWLRSSLLKVMP